MKSSKSITGKIWTLRGERKGGESLFDAFRRVRNFSEDFLREPDYSHLASSESLPGIICAAERIEQAIARNEKVLIFGDFDSDGASGSAALYLALKTLGSEVSVVLPSRSDGYGLSEKAYDHAKDNGVSLLITVDCGSSNSAQIEYGNSLGIDTIITDHHSLPEILPLAVSIVHPHLGKPGDATWDLTGAGVAFFLSKLLLERQFGENGIQPLLARLAELAVLGTVADVGLLVGQNRILTHLGVRQLRQTQHPGLRALIQAAKIPFDKITAESIAFFLAPRLNAAGRLAHPNLALSLLLGSAKAAAELEDLNNQRKEVTTDLCLLAEKMITDPHQPAFVLYNDRFFSGVAGLIAARVAEKFHRPAVVLSPASEDGVLTASCRGPEDFHFTKALQETAHLLSKFGGHACAAGFSMPAKNLAEFERLFSEIAAGHRGAEPPPAQVVADFETEMSDFSISCLKNISRAAPFGVGNPEALFCLRNVRMSNAKVIGSDGTHMAGRFRGGAGQLPFVAFRFADVLPQTQWESHFDAIVSADINNWNGNEEVRLKVVDLREAIN